MRSKPWEGVFWRGKRVEDLVAQGAVKMEDLQKEILNQYNQMVNAGGLLGAGGGQAGSGPGILGQAGGGGGGGGAAFPVSTQTTAKVTVPLPLKHHSPDALAGMIAARMRYPTAKSMPFDHLHPVAINEQKVIVLVVKGEQHAVIEDDGQFPSDVLINQLRLMID